MKFHLVTLFQDACDAYLNASIIGRARKEKKISIKYQNPRDFVDNKWGKVDERPYGGNLRHSDNRPPVVKAVEKTPKTRGAKHRGRSCIIWFSPSGKQFTNKDADALAKYSDIVLVSYRYEGIDERAKKVLKTIATIKEFAVGEAVYTGGEVPALAIVDAVARRLPGVLGKDASVEERRIASSAVYTRPETILYKGKTIASLASSKSYHHANIDKWRKER